MDTNVIWEDLKQHRSTSATLRCMSPAPSQHALCVGTPIPILAEEFWALKSTLFKVVEKL